MRDGEGGLGGGGMDDGGDGMWGQAERKKKGCGSHCHANWRSVQTPMSHTGRLKGEK